jgi:hypothetical protein
MTALDSSSSVKCPMASIYCRHVDSYKFHYAMCSNETETCFFHECSGNLVLSRRRNSVGSSSACDADLLLKQNFITDQRKKANTIVHILSDPWHTAIFKLRSK